MRSARLLTSIAMLAAFAGIASGQSVKLDPGLASYKPVQGISGNIKSVGSDSMNNEMALWAEGFRKFYPGVKIEIEGT